MLSAQHGMLVQEGVLLQVLTIFHGDASGDNPHEGVSGREADSGYEHKKNWAESDGVQMMYEI